MQPISAALDFAPRKSRRIPHAVLSSRPLPVVGIDAIYGAPFEDAFISTVLEVAFEGDLGQRTNVLNPNSSPFRSEARLYISFRRRKG